MTHDTTCELLIYNRACTCSPITCQECGNDDATEGYLVCSDCLEDQWLTPEGRNAIPSTPPAS